METTLITITLLLIGVSSLAISTMLGVILLKIFCIYPKKVKNNTVSTQPPATPIDEDALKRRQREYEEQLTAINDLMNYSQDIAYGIKPKDY